MKKFFLSLCLCICSLLPVCAEVDMSVPLIVPPETKVVDLDTDYPKITYLEIMDSPNRLTIVPGHKSPKLTNDKLYIGRNIETKIRMGNDYEKNSTYPWIGDNVIKEYILGEEATQFPVHYYSWGILGPSEESSYFEEEYTLELLYRPYSNVSEDEKSVLRINCKKLYDYSAQLNDKTLLKETNLKKKYRIEKIIIGEKCEQLPGNYFQEYIPLIVEAPNPPELVPAFTRLAYDKTPMVAVPDESIELYRNHQEWGKFKNLMSRSEYEASLSLNKIIEYSMPNLRIENGELVCSNDLNEDLNIYASDGRMIYRGRDTRVAVPNGVIIVRYGDKTKKFISK